MHHNKKGSDKNMNKKRETMKTGIAILALLLTLMVSCYNASKKDEKVNETKTERNLAGGWHETNVTPTVENAVDFVLQQMNTSAKLDKIVNVKMQVVKGRNYDIDFKLDNG